MHGKETGIHTDTVCDLGQAFSGNELKPDCGEAGRVININLVIAIHDFTAEVDEYLIFHKSVDQGHVVAASFCKRSM